MLACSDLLGLLACWPVWPASIIVEFMPSAVRLHDEGAREGLSSRRPGPQRHLAVVPARRQDRRARPERRRQVDAAQDHGRRRTPTSSAKRLPARASASAILPQEPQLNPAKDVRGNVEEGVAEIKALLDRYDAVNTKLGEDMSPEEMDKVARRAVAAAGSHRRHQRLGPRLASRARDGRAAAAAARRRRHHAVGRRAPPRGAVPAAAAVARSAAARRTDQPPRRRVGGVARALPQGLSRAPSSRSRTTATSSTTSPAGFSSSIAAAASRTKATTPAGSSRSRTACSRKRRPRASASARCSASSTGSACRRAPARPRARRA